MDTEISRKKSRSNEGGLALGNVRGIRGNAKMSQNCFYRKCWDEILSQLQLCGDSLHESCANSVDLYNSNHFE